MIQQKYRAASYAPELVKSRYVGKGWSSGGGYVIYHVDANKLTILEQYATADEIPEDVRAAADAAHGTAFSQVEWPL